VRAGCRAGAAGQCGAGQSCRPGCADRAGDTGQSRRLLAVLAVLTVLVMLLAVLALVGCGFTVVPWLTLVGSFGGGSDGVISAKPTQDRVCSFSGAAEPSNPKGFFLPNPIGFSGLHGFVIIATKLSLSGDVGIAMPIASSSGAGSLECGASSASSTASESPLFACSTSNSKSIARFRVAALRRFCAVWRANPYRLVRLAAWRGHRPTRCRSSGHRPAAAARRGSVAQIRRCGRWR
jgi:hypothetical protein